jgi:FKBP-type peptidyl-prolyl cis-trans isomerase SlyD
MKIDKDTVVTLQYKVSEPSGKLLDEAKEPMAYLHGGYGNTLEKIEAALDGQLEGYQTTLHLKAEDAFGLRDESLVQTIARKDFPPGVKVGGQLQGRSAEGQETSFTVMKIKGDTVFLDANHPWAGKDLSFMLKVTEVRAATSEEVNHKHVHGAHGHHH